MAAGPGGEAPIRLAALGTFPLQGKDLAPAPLINFRIRPADEEPMLVIAFASEACGAELRYLPAYSPDFNPIEMGFSKLKALVRKTAARTFDGLETATANALTKFPPSECQNFFRHAGYG